MSETQIPTPVLVAQAMTAFPQPPSCVICCQIISRIRRGIANINTCTNPSNQTAVIVPQARRHVFRDHNHHIPSTMPRCRYHPVIHRFRYCWRQHIRRRLSVVHHRQRAPLRSADQFSVSFELGENIPAGRAYLYQQVPPRRAAIQMLLGTTDSNLMISAMS